MSVKINVNGNYIDMIDMIKDGTYNEKKTIGPITGLPSGQSSLSTWTAPNNFGIIYNGTDISTYYEANYTDSVIAIPDNVKKIKVICIGGGQGGQYGQATTSCTSVWCGNSKYAKGRNGQKGADGEKVFLELDVGPKTYTTKIGDGGKEGIAYKKPGGQKSNPFTTSDGVNTSVLAPLGSNGGDTTFTYNGTTYTAKGGGNVIVTAVNNSTSNISFTQGRGGDGGIGGAGGGNSGISMDRNNLTNNNSVDKTSGSPGNSGLVRVYFLY